jgi:hypothetical protein
MKRQERRRFHVRSVTGVDRNTARQQSMGLVNRAVCRQRSDIQTRGRDVQPIVVGPVSQAATQKATTYQIVSAEAAGNHCAPNIVGGGAGTATVKVQIYNRIAQDDLATADDNNPTACAGAVSIVVSAVIGDGAIGNSYRRRATARTIGEHSSTAPVGMVTAKSAVS